MPPEDKFGYQHCILDECFFIREREKTTVIADVRKVANFKISNGTGFQKDGSNTTHELTVDTTSPLNGTYLLQCLVKGQSYRPGNVYYAPSDALITSK